MAVWWPLKRFDILRFTVRRQFAVGLIFVLATWGVYFITLWPRMFGLLDDELRAAWPVHFELDLHYGYANFFAHTSPDVWIRQHPLFINTSFAYPFAADFIAGMFLRFTSFSYETIFLNLSIVTAVAMVAALYFFYFRVFQKAVLACVSVTIFLACGGSGFTEFLGSFFAEPSFDLFANPPGMYTWLTDMPFHNIISSELFSQRSLPLGIALGVFILGVLVGWVRKDFNGVSRFRLIALGFLAGLMVVVHIHSYLAVAVASFVFLIWKFKYWKHWLPFAVSAVVLSLILYALFYYPHISSSIIKWDPAWQMIDPVTPTRFVDFWFLNWGFLFFAAFAGLFIREEYKYPLQAAGIILFIIGNTFALQPSAWDNIKLFNWAYLLLTIPAVSALAWLWRSKMLFAWPASVLLFLFMIASGLLDITSLYKSDAMASGYTVATAEDRVLGENFRSIARRDAVVLAAQANSWVLTYGGHPLVLFDRNWWLWTYGVDKTQTEVDVQNIYAGLPHAGDLIEQYNIEYIVVGPLERSVYPVNEEFFSKFPIILDSFGTRIYDVSSTIDT